MSTVPPSQNSLPAPLPPRFALSSQIGGRAEQQDSAEIFYQPGIGTALFVVCDGVGGSRGGQVASSTVVETARQLWETRQGHLADPQSDLFKLCQIAHERIQSLALEGEKRAPASTIVVLYLTATEAHWVHSGDSRLYHFRGGQLASRTRDHSVVQVLVDQGEVAEESMGTHPDQGRLLQSLGSSEFRDPSYGQATASLEDAFLLCTDGFWERTPVAQMNQLLFGGSNLAEGLAKLTTAAVSANGPNSDNVTALAVAAPGSRSATAVSPSSTSTRRLDKVQLGLVGALVASLAFVGWSAWERFRPRNSKIPSTDLTISTKPPKLVSPPPPKIEVRQPLPDPSSQRPTPDSSKPADSPRENERSGGSIGNEIGHQPPAAENAVMSEHDGKQPPPRSDGDKAKEAKEPAATSPPAISTEKVTPNAPRDTTDRVLEPHLADLPGVAFQRTADGFISQGPITQAALGWVMLGPLSQEDLRPKAASEAEVSEYCRTLETVIPLLLPSPVRWRASPEYEKDSGKSGGHRTFKIQLRRVTIPTPPPPPPSNPLPRGIPAPLSGSEMNLQPRSLPPPSQSLPPPPVNDRRRL